MEITRLGSAFVTGMHMAVGRGVFALAFGEEGVAQLEALVAAGGEAETSRPLPDAIQRVRHLAPLGWNGVGVADLSALLGGQLVLVLEALDEALPRQMRFGFSIDATQEWLDVVRPLVEKHDLESLVSLSGWNDGRWRLRIVW